jgi:hypothetical protein
MSRAVVGGTIALSFRKFTASLGRPLARIFLPVFTRSLIWRRNQGSYFRRQNLLDGCPVAEGTGDDEQAIRRWRAKGGADGVLVVAFARPGFDFVKTAETGFKAAQRFCTLSWKVRPMADFANGFHGGGKMARSREFSKAARDFGDDVINGGLEGCWCGAAGDVVGQFIACSRRRAAAILAMGSRWLPKQGQTSAKRGVHFDDKRPSAGSAELDVGAAGFNADSRSTAIEAIAHDPNGIPCGQVRAGPQAMDRRCERPWDRRSRWSDDDAVMFLSRTTSIQILSASTDSSISTSAVGGASGRSTMSKNSSQL